MSKLTIFLLLITYYLASITFPTPTYANTQPSPITGTFVMNDFQILDQATMNSYLQGMKDVGIDTIIWYMSGAVHRGDEIHRTGGEFLSNNEDCWSSTIFENNFFTENFPNYLANADKLLSSIHDQNMNVYIGLAGTGSCHDWWRGNPNTPGSNSYSVINLSRKLILSYQDLCTRKNWDCSFVKGFYIPSEQAIHALSWRDPAEPDILESRYFVVLSRLIKTLEPTKKIMLSPYKNESTSYQAVYDGAYWILANTEIDILAPQDSMGTGLVTSMQTNSEQYRAVRDAVVRINNERPNKHAEAWGNIESYLPFQNGYQVHTPPSLSRLLDQMNAVEPYVSKKITWIYSWSLANDELLSNLNTGQYNPEFAAYRRDLRNQYITNIVNPNSTPSPSPSHSSYAPSGDLTGDGKVDIFDYQRLISNFGNPYTIFDYQRIISNFGK